MIRNVSITNSAVVNGKSAKYISGKTVYAVNSFFTKKREISKIIERLALKEAEKNSAA